MNATIDDCRVSVYTIPTDKPESDGTLQWDSTTLILVELIEGDCCGIGYTYSSPAAATLIQHQLRPIVLDMSPMNIPAAYHAMVHQTRNLGRPGIVSMAISAIDVALWDLKSKLLSVSLSTLLGQVRNAVPVYGSGGFTSYSDDELREQTRGWVEEGIDRIKIKVGRDAIRDPHRVKIVRDAIGDAELFIDANGGYRRKQAIALMQEFADLGVTWLEEPVPSDDLDGLRLIRDTSVPGIDITAGEYGFQSSYFRRMLESGAVDVLQADATRCGGITGFLAAAAISNAFLIPISSHCAPSLHVHLGCAVSGLRHIEYFHDHVRIEQMSFDGFTRPEDGKMKPSLDRNGLGLEFKHQDMEDYRVKGP